MTAAEPELDESAAATLADAAPDEPAPAAAAPHAGGRRPRRRWPRCRAGRAAAAFPEGDAEHGALAREWSRAAGRAPGPASSRRSPGAGRGCCTSAGRGTRSTRASRTGPAVLFVEGDRADVLDRPRVAVVGTRAATPHGLADARELGAALARAGVVVVSGLAIGIDGEAHEGALDAGGMVIGVVATGLDVVYPRRHGIAVRPGARARAARERAARSASDRSRPGSRSATGSSRRSPT